MSRPYGDTGRSLSNPVSHSSLGPSSIPPSNAVSLPIFGQKLIPRDFLGTRSKTSPETTSNVSSGASKTLFSTDPFRKDRTAERRDLNTLPDNSRVYDISPTTVSFPDYITQKNNELKIPKTKSPTSNNFPSTVKTRSKSSGASSFLDSGALDRLIMPRTSSIDSAISNVSINSLSKAAGDLRDPSPTSVRNLIATAGGAESLVTHLLKDKNTIASQNAQLWKLVEKQRTLLLGLNKDLERITKERDKYKKRVKELEMHTIDEVGQNVQPNGFLPTRNEIPTATDIDPAHQMRHNVENHINDGKNTIQRDASRDKIFAPTREGQDVRSKEINSVVQAPNPILPEAYTARPITSNAPRLQPRLEIPDGGPPTFNITEATPLNDKSSKLLPTTRKAPPKPLNLGQGREDEIANNQNTNRSDSDEDSGRGRRRTREEDDRDREMSAIKAEAEARSRSSKKNKVPKLLTQEEKQTTSQIQVPAPLPTPGLPLSPRPQHAQVFAAPSTHLSAVNTQQPFSLNDRLLATSLKSPGLPLSPRPLNRNEGPSIVTSSLPLSPRVNMGAFPLSPRAPKTALPMPTNLAAPTDAAALQATQSRAQQTSQATTSSNIDRLQAYQPTGSEAPLVYRGLAVSAYPDLLLPPNALPSIQVQVHSSRLRPSRHSVLPLKNQEEATVFSLSVISRSSNSELWRIEKFPASLPQLELQLKLRCTNLPRMPDRKLFIGQSPASLDERRQAIDKYFEDLLDTHIDEVAAIAICRFLSTDVIDPEQSKGAFNGSNDTASQTPSSGQPATKTGYLTKKGKNFGGWKSRFFILDGPEFRYYESAGGPHSGTIRLHNALIGKQKDNDTIDDPDGQYRHAFLIQEPKRKDSGSYLRHVLCAESDAERDDWVRQILYWTEVGVTSRSGSRSEQSTSASTSQEFNDLENRYQNSKAGPSSKDTRDTHPNTPTPTSSSSIDSSILDNMIPVKSASISGPMNGGVITDNSIWGYKPTPNSTTKESKDKTHKMSNIFGFKKPDPQVVQQEQKPPKPRILRHNGYVRPVFGLPLAEAVEFCSPFNVEIDLPAVVYRSIEYLRHMNAANEEGLFRLSGSNIVVRNLKERFNTEGDIDLISEDEYHDVHAVASLFKTYLRELPSTLLTRELHIEFIKVLELESQSDKVAAYNTLVHMLPAANFSLLKEMARYLLEVTENADKNKMSVRNVGIVFSPTLNIPTPVFTLLLTEFKAIFETKSNQGPEIRSTEITAPVTLTPDEIRSPRHQMFSDLPTPAYNQSTFAGHTAMVPPRGTMTGTGELGFMPINPGYETNTFASAAYRNVTTTTPPAAMTQAADVGGFSSLNGLLAPTNGPTDRAKKRHSMMLSSG